jgi:CheY-like chemotaxis protein
MRSTPFKVLVVDEEQLLLLALERACKGCSLDIQTATTTQQALAEIKGCHFDLFMIDFDLNNQDQIELLKAVDGHCPYVPVIIMTTADKQSCELHDAIRTIRKQGTWHLLEKPFSLDRMMSFIDTIFQNQRDVKLGQNFLPHNYDQERRSKLRRPFVKPVTFTTKTLDEGGMKKISVDGILTDISDFGLGVLAYEQVQPDQVISFEDDFIKIGGVVAWSVMIDRATCRFGVQFC